MENWTTSPCFSSFLRSPRALNLLHVLPSLIPDGRIERFMHPAQNYPPQRGVLFGQLGVPAAPCCSYARTDATSPQAMSRSACPDRFFLNFCSQPMRSCTAADIGSQLRCRRRRCSHLHSAPPAICKVHSTPCEEPASKLTT